MADFVWEQPLDKGNFGGGVPISALETRTVLSHGKEREGAFPRVWGQMRGDPPETTASHTCPGNIPMGATPGYEEIWR